MVTQIDCTPPNPKMPQLPYYVANFVPAHQVIELEYFKNAHSEPYRTRLVLSWVERFD